MDSILSQLNDSQRAAAACTEGPVMIIAGAGSGKTRTLTYRIAHLIEKGVDPFQILSLTFTNKAGKEMKDRITALVGTSAKNIWMGTFHSIFARILRMEAARIGFTNTFTIYDTDDSKSAVRRIVKQLNLDNKIYAPNVVLNRISMAKSNLLLPGDYASNPTIQADDKESKRPLIAEIYKVYQQRLFKANAMDFDDLLLNVNILFRDCPDVLLKYQQRFQYILVDEYQDTNYSQYLIVKKLAARHQNICVVGDDAQSIYAFRGANIQNILNFKRDYPDVKLFKLEQNYRSTQNIVGAANSVISQNKYQIPKTIWTDNGKGEKIKVVVASDERDEGRKVADAIQAARLDYDMEYKDFAILYRQNSQSRSIEEALRRLNVPYCIYQGISFYSRLEIKDVLAYLRLVVNNHDDESLVRIINKPARGIGDTTLNKVRTAALDHDISIWTVLENLGSFDVGINAGVASRISDFVIMIKRFTSMSFTTDAYTLARQVVMASGLIKALRENEDPDNPGRIENIEELLNGIQEFCEKDDDITPNADTTESVKTLDQFLQQVLLLTSEDKNKEDLNKVSLMTIHAAKGLEFPYVFVVGMEENIFPSAMSIPSRADLEEERRLFYVAVTRAMKYLSLSYATFRYLYGKSSCQEPSRFVSEIDSQFVDRTSAESPFPQVGQMPKAFFQFGKPSEQQSNSHTSTAFKPRPKTTSTVFRPKAPTPPASPADIAKIQAGMRVRHAKFGFGKVLSVEEVNGDRRAIVFFDNLDQKTLILKFAKLEIVE